MAGLDSFLLLTPFLMLAVVGLLVFVGCQFSTNPVQPMLSLEANPGIPSPATRITPVDLTWNTDADTKVYRSTDSNGPWGTVGETSSGSYTDVTVMDGTTYYYKVDAGEAGAGGPVSVTPQPPFVSAFNTLGGFPMNISGYFGMAVQVGGNPVAVYALGRYMVAGNSRMHNLIIVDPSNDNAVIATLIVNMAGGTPDNFVYGALPMPVTLNANANYYVVSQEDSAGDQWHDNSTNVLTTPVAAVTGSVEGSGTTYTATNTLGATYGPLDFLYL